MTTDADDKSQSKFPRASLRARNRTLMMTPADIEDFQVTSKKRPNRESDVMSGGDDPLSALDDDSGDARGESVDRRYAEIGGSPEASQSFDDGLEVLSEALDSNTEDDAMRVEHADEVGLDSMVDRAAESAISAYSEREHDLVDAEDIFAAPGEKSALSEDLFEGMSAASVKDPIHRGTRSAQSVLSAFGASVPTGAGLDSRQDLRVVDGARGGVLHGTPSSHQDSAQGHRSDETREYVDWKKLGKLVGFLVSYVSDAMGRYVELREGRLLVTSGESSSDSALVIFDESVSPMHAIMRISADGTILILDQLSEHGTRIRRAESGKVESLMGDKSTLCHGDVVIFGECEYHVVVMGRAALKRDDVKED